MNNALIGSEIFYNCILFPIANLFESSPEFTEIEKYSQEITFNKIHYQRLGLQ